MGILTTILGLGALFLILLVLFIIITLIFWIAMFINAIQTKKWGWVALFVITLFCGFGLLVAIIYYFVEHRKKRKRR